MSEYQLAAESRTDTGKGAARRVRAAGRVPAVLYGHGIKPEHLSIDAREFGQAIRSGGASARCNATRCAAPSSTSTSWSSAAVRR